MSAWACLRVGFLPDVFEELMEAVGVRVGGTRLMLGRWAERGTRYNSGK